MQDMVSNLNKATKAEINPFIIGKLDLETIANFEFVNMSREQNRYLKRDDGPIRMKMEEEEGNEIKEVGSGGNR